MRTRNPAIVQTFCWRLGGQSTEIYNKCRVPCQMFKVKRVSVAVVVRSNWPSSRHKTVQWESRKLSA